MTVLHLDIIKLIQEDIEIKQEPFAHIINALNVNYPTLFENLNELKDAGVMRRFASMKTKEETNGIIADIASEIEHRAKRPLCSTREFKKVRLKYFTPSFLEWEEKHLKDNL